MKPLIFYAELHEQPILHFSTSLHSVLEDRYLTMANQQVVFKRLQA